MSDCEVPDTEGAVVRQDDASFWRSVADQHPDMLILIDREARVVYINRTNPPFTREQVIGTTGFAYLDEQQKEGLRAALVRVFDHGEAVEFDPFIPAAQRWYHCRITPFREGGEIRLATISLSDVTERRAQEQIWREKAAQFQMVAEQMPAVLWVTDCELRFTSLFGAGLEDPASSTQIAGTPLAVALQDTPDLQKIVDSHQKALAGQTVSYDSFLHGQHYQAHIQPLVDEQQQIIGVVGAALNVTEMKSVERELREARDFLEARVAERTQQLQEINEKLETDIARREIVERALRESEERFRMIAELTPIPITITLQSDGTFLFANARTSEEIGEKPGNLIGRNASEFLLDPDLYSQLVSRLHAEGHIRDLEILVDNPSRGHRWVSICMRPIHFDWEPAVLTSLLDITERREAEEELRAERNLLTRLVDLHERDRQLIAFEIHDGLVQDITAALMFSEATTATLHDPDRSRENLGQVTRILRETLQESRRLMAGLSPPILDEAGVIPAIEDLIQELRERGAPPIKLIHDGTLGRLAPALEMAIYRIVQESLNNILQHAQSPRAKVEMRRRDDNLILTIRDWGIGFDLKTTKKKRYGLTGLQERSKLLGGKCEIRSTPGEGTTIRILLPLIDLLPQHSGDDDLSSAHDLTEGLPEAEV